MKKKHNDLCYLFYEFFFKFCQLGFDVNCSCFKHFAGDSNHFWTTRMIRFAVQALHSILVVNTINSGTFRLYLNLPYQIQSLCDTITSSKSVSFINPYSLQLCFSSQQVHNICLSTELFEKKTIQKTLFSFVVSFQMQKLNWFQLEKHHENLYTFRLKLICVLKRKTLVT